jgi:hypothetical protein
MGRGRGPEGAKNLAKFLLRFVKNWSKKLKHGPFCLVLIAELKLIYLLNVCGTPKYFGGTSGLKNTALKY